MSFLFKLVTATAALTAVIPAASAAGAELHGQWSMSTSGATVPGMGGTEPLALYGQWRPAVGAAGQAVEFFHPEVGYGVAHGSEGDNPLTEDFAMAVTFSSDPIPTGVKWSGNVMQKGLANKQGQVKISLQAANGGTTFCRVKGTNGYKVLKSKVVIDDGAFHTAVCWREGGTIGLTVDGTPTTLAFNPGSVATTQPVRVGNKSATADWSDQHFGRNDCSVWVIGSGARVTASSLTPC